MTGADVCNRRCTGSHRVGRSGPEQVRGLLWRYPIRAAATAMTSGYNWFLIIITVVVSILAIGVALYLLTVYQHPEDRNQVRCRAPP